MEKLSVYMIALNEERRLERTLEAVSKIADEIVIVDGGSTDKTLEIAKKFNAKTTFNAWKNFSHQKRTAQNLCENKWVLNIDADEVLTDEFIQEINRMKEKGFDKNAYRIKVVDMYPSWKKPKFLARMFDIIRLYHRDYMAMPDDYSHDRPVFIRKDAQVGQIKALVWHYSYTDLTKTIDKWNRYSTEFMSTAKGHKRHYSMFRLMFEFPYQFFRYYFLRGYIFSGFYGLVIATTIAYFRFVKIAKHKEDEILEKLEKEAD